MKHLQAKQIKTSLKTPNPMNIEKVKTYNQKLLAVLGTIVALMVLIGLLSILYFVGVEIASSFESKSEDDVFIVFAVAATDSYKDGIVNSKDLKKLYIYSVKEQKLKDIGLNNADVITYKFIGESKNLLVQFGIDYNKDGKYDSSKEPKTPRSFNYKSGMLRRL